MTERWRQPVILVGIESSTDTMRIGERTYRDYEYIIKRDDWERIRTGYVCIQCFEPHETPFPDRCPVCGTTAREQRERIPQERNPATDIDLDPRYADEEAQLAEENERRIRAKQDHPQIWLPKKEW